MESFLKKYSKKIIIILVAFIAIALVAVAGTWWSYNKASNKYGSEVLAVVGSDQITTTDFKHFAYAVLRQGTPDNPTLPENESDKLQLLNTAIEKLLVMKEAKEQNFAVTDAQALASLQTKDPNYNKQILGAAYILDYEKYLLEKDKLTEKIGGNKTGTIITAREDVYYPEDGNITPAIQKKITNNATYAETFINDIYAKLNAGTMTAAEAVSLENKDATIGENANPLVQTFHSMIFTNNDYKTHTGLLSHQEILASVNSLKAGEISKPIHVISSDNIVGNYKNIGWFIVVLDKTSGSSGQTFAEWLSSKENSVGATIVGDLSKVS